MYRPPESELSWRFSRSSGPGGQGVNTTDSRVELSFDVAGSPTLPTHLRARALARLHRRLVDGVLTVVATEHRSQLRTDVEPSITLILRSLRDLAGCDELMAASIPPISIMNPEPNGPAEPRAGANADTHKRAEKPVGQDARQPGAAGPERANNTDPVWTPAPAQTR